MHPLVPVEAEEGAVVTVAMNPVAGGIREVTMITDLEVVVLEDEGVETIAVVEAVTEEEEVVVDDTMMIVNDHEEMVTILQTGIVRCVM